MTCQSRCSTTRPQTQQSIPFLTPFETDDLHEKAGEDKGHRPDPESWLACPRFGSSNSSCLLDATNPTSTRNVLPTPHNHKPNSPYQFPPKATPAKRNYRIHARTPHNTHTTHTTHTSSNGPSQGIPRDAARVRQGRPPVHHQVQQAYVFPSSFPPLKGIRLFFSREL